MAAHGSSPGNELIGQNGGVPVFVGPCRIGEAHPSDIGAQLFGYDSGAGFLLKEDGPSGRNWAIPAPDEVDGPASDAQGIRHMLQPPDESAGPTEKVSGDAHDSILAGLTSEVKSNVSESADNAIDANVFDATLDDMAYDPRKDGLRMKEIFNAYKKRTGDSREAFAKRNGFHSANNLGQYFGGHTELNVERATAFAHGVGCKVDDFSPYWASMVRKTGFSTDYVLPEEDGQAESGGIETHPDYPAAMADHMRAVAQAESAQLTTGAKMLAMAFDSLDPSVKYAAFEYLTGEIQRIRAGKTRLITGG